jgi:hypothetical protein
MSFFFVVKNLLVSKLRFILFFTNKSTFLLYSIELI